MYSAPVSCPIEALSLFRLSEFVYLKRRRRLLFLVPRAGIPILPFTLHHQSHFLIADPTFRPLHFTTAILAHLFAPVAQVVGPPATLFLAEARTAQID
ncbi:hypothetical protein PaG_01541 [Moesziomyces aphidis]|uniref:Uncharacterized protein n=1 Tax=Moesziomyces aphidis TaxID=84754 RepID=W3VR78_MOEAP|nr:hypothetical protein PaG_01541 [Moesziomyces aphidis]